MEESSMRRDFAYAPLLRDFAFRPQIKTPIWVALAGLLLAGRAAPAAAQELGRLRRFKATCRPAAPRFFLHPDTCFFLGTGDDCVHTSPRDSANICSHLNFRLLERPPSQNLSSSGEAKLRPGDPSTRQRCRFCESSAVLLGS